MQNRQERRVRKLRLAAASEDELRCGVGLIKDAFHVASLPGRSDDRFLIIRSLQIGRFSPNSSSAYLATVIERKLMEIVSKAVRGDHPNANSYPAVYFLDEVEPYIVLAVRIARGDDTSAWFWPLAAKGWRPRMSPGEALRAILYRVAVAESYVIGIATLVRELRERDLIDQLLSTLSTDDAEQLMRTWGWLAAIPAAEPSPSQSALDLEISAGARHTLDRWVNRWGTTDARSKWLAAILLIEEKPARLLDRHLLSRAVRLIEISKTSTSTAISDRRLTSRERREYFDPGPSANLSLSKPSAPEARDSLPDDLPDNLATTAGGRLPYEINAGDALDELRERARLLSSTDAPSPESLAGYDNLANTNSRNIIAPVSDSLENLRKRHGGCSFPSSTGASSLDSPPDMLEIAGVGADLQSPEEARPTSNRNSPEAQSPEKARRMSGRLAGEMAGTISSHDAPDPQPAMSSARGNRLEKHTWSGSRIDSPGAFDPLEDSNLESYQTSLFLQGGAQPTEFGGFYFLLSIISRLGMASFLETNPHLIDLDFAAHLLRFLSAQLRIPVADPALSSLTTPEESAPQMIEFSLPPVWRERLYRSGPLVLGRINGETGCRILTDRSRKIVLSSWRGPTPRAVREMIGDGHVKRVAYPPANAGATDKNEKVTGALFNSWHRAIRRWCRAYAGLTLPELINRRALITSTRTHTDLFFDVRKADIRIRRAGLDLDPGWVPWLGRAVSFHYLEEEEIDGC